MRLRPPSVHVRDSIDVEKAAPVAVYPPKPDIPRSTSTVLPIESLILIDSPNPVGLGKLPKRMYDIPREIRHLRRLRDGRRGRHTAPPDWAFLALLRSSSRSLDRYMPPRFERRGAAPRTTIICAAGRRVQEPAPRRCRTIRAA